MIIRANSQHTPHCLKYHNFPNRTVSVWNEHEMPSILPIKPLWMYDNRYTFLHVKFSRRRTAKIVHNISQRIAEMHTEGHIRRGGSCAEGQKSVWIFYVHQAILVELPWMTHQSIVCPFAGGEHVQYKKDWREKKLVQSFVSPREGNWQGVHSKWLCIWCSQTH